MNRRYFVCYFLKITITFMLNVLFCIQTSFAITSGDIFEDIIPSLDNPSLSVVINGERIKTINSNEKLTLIANVSNCPSCSITYTWSATGGSFSNKSGNQVVWSPPNNLNVDVSFLITVTINDGKGHTASDVIEVEVKNIDFIVTSHVFNADTGELSVFFNKQVDRTSLISNVTFNGSVSGSHIPTFEFDNFTNILNMTSSKKFYNGETVTVSFNTGVKDINGYLLSAPYTAQFTIAGTTQTTNTFKLTYLKSGTGSGIVTSSPSGISCSDNCEGSLERYKNFTLTASPQPGSVFAYWSGDACSGSTSPNCSFSMDSDKTISAVFTSNAPAPETCFVRNVISKIVPYSVIISGSNDPCRSSFSPEGVYSARFFTFTIDKPGKVGISVGWANGRAQHFLGARLYPGSNPTPYNFIEAQDGIQGNKIFNSILQPGTYTIGLGVIFNNNQYLPDTFYVNIIMPPPSRCYSSLTPGGVGVSGYFADDGCLVLLESPSLGISPGFNKIPTRLFNFTVPSEGEVLLYSGISNFTKNSIEHNPSNLVMNLYKGNDITGELLQISPVFSGSSEAGAIIAQASKRLEPGTYTLVVSGNSIKTSGQIVYEGKFDVKVNTPPSSICYNQLNFDTPTNGRFDTNCISQNSFNNLARYYNFTLSSNSTVSISLTSSVMAQIILRSGSTGQGSIIERSTSSYSPSMTKQLTSGSYTVEVTTANGYSIGEFTLKAQRNGTVSVTIQPQEAINGGAKWRLSNTTNWQDSGSSQSVGSGNYVLEFLPINGWKEPSSTNVSVVADQNLNISDNRALYSKVHTITPVASAGGYIYPFLPIDALTNETKQFTLTPDIGYAIASVSGCNGSLSGNTYTTGPITSSCVVTATFRQNANITLTVTKSGNGSGMVTSSPSGINCGSTCSASFNNNATVTLTATADTNSTFNGWSGCDSTGGSTCTVVMNASKSITATFNRSSGQNIHPADTDGNSSISTGECVAYAMAWKLGQQWSIGPNPVPMEYAINACLIWKQGETYRYDPGVTPPWVSAR